MKKKLALFLALCLTLSACGGQASTEESAAPQPSAQSGDRAETADVVIVGGGITGLMAATEFARNYPDLDVVVLEQLGIAGGSAMYSEGLVLGFTDTAGKDMTAFASPELFSELFHISSKTMEDHGFVEPGYQVNDALVANVFRNMPTVYQYLQDMGCNVHYEDIPYYNENSSSDKVYCYPADGAGAGLMTAVIKSITESGKTDLRLNSQVTGLLTGGNKVVGVSVTDKEGSYDIHSKFVFLATGGTGNNKELLNEYNPAYSECYVETNPGANGDGITFTRQFDTPLVGDGMLGLISSDDDTFALMASNFMVDKNGKRFANETLNYFVLLSALMNTAEGDAWVIADQAYYEANRDEVDYKLDVGTVTIYNSLEEVCEATGINAENLNETIAAYNADAEAGKTLEFDLDPAMAHPIHEGPYYVEKASTYCFGSIRSIQVNENLQVLNGSGEPVEGLYAGGELTLGNIMNGQYAKSGGCISYGANSGVEAAKQIGSSF